MADPVLAECGHWAVFVVIATRVEHAFALAFADVERIKFVEGGWRAWSEGRRGRVG